MHDLLAKIRRCWWIVASAVALGLSGAAALTFTADPLYVSSAKVYLSTRATAGTSLVQASQFAQQQVASYVQLATSPFVLQPVIARLNLPVTSAELAGQVTASSPEGTSVIALEVKSGDRREAALIVNAVADELIKAVAIVERPTTTAISPIGGAVIQRGAEPSKAVSPKPAYNLGLGLLLGLLLGAVGSIARESWDDRQRNQAGLIEDIGVPVIGGLASAPQLQTLGPQHGFPHQGDLGDFRRVRANLYPRLAPAGLSTILITSASAGEGKTTLAAGLAAALAEEVSRVLVVDADLRTAALSGRLAPHAEKGLSGVLQGDGRDALSQVVTHEAFDVLPAGGVVRDPGHLLTRRRLTPVLEQLEGRYDVVLVDMPSVEATSEAAGLSPLATVTLLVVNPQGTTPAAISAAICAVESAGGHVAGAVINEYRKEKARRGGPLRRPRQMRRSTDRQGGESTEKRRPGTRMARGARGVGERVRHVRRDVPDRGPALPVVRRPQPVSGAPAAGDVPRA